MKQQHYLLAIAAVALLGMTACHKDCEDPITPWPDQQEIPNPLPANALVKQLKWAENDHQTFTYNAQNQVKEYRSQWQFVENDPTQIKMVVYDFEYDAQHRPVEVKATGDFSAKYFYKNNLIEKTQELKANGTLAKEVIYVYNRNRIVQENWIIPGVAGEPADVYKHIFSYDDAGNLNKTENFYQQADLSFKLIETVIYSDFDNKINPTSWLLRYPYLPQVRFQLNNPRKEERISGGTTTTITYAYEYNAAGLPVSRQRTGPGGVLIAQYQY